MTWKLKLNLRIKKQEKENLPTAYLVDRLYLPEQHVNIKLARKYYDRRIYDQKKCNYCPVYKNGERFSPESCSPCDNFKGRYTTFEEVTINNVEYLAFPAGSPEKVAQNLDLNLKQFNIIDNRCDARVKYPLKFTGKLFTGKEMVNGFAMADQRAIVKEFAPHKRGLIESPPRSGKTVIIAYIIVGSKRITLYLAHEKQLLLQFYKTMLKFTDLREQRKITGKKICGIVENEKDLLEDWDIVICNYQKFLSALGIERILKYLIKRFGQAVVDECHRSAARGYINLLNKLDCKRKIGMSATLTRKDGMQFLQHQMLGEIAAKGIVVTRPPIVKIIDTGLKTTKKFGGRAGYTYANQWLAKHKDRTKLIIKNIFADLRQNKQNSIVIPVMFKSQAAKLARMINAQGQFNNQHKGEDWPDLIAHPYYDDRSINRTQVLERVRSGEIRVLIAIRKMVKEGIDVPRWNIMYCCFPFNNDEDFYQMTSRVLNNYEGKPQSMIKFFVDHIGLSLGCFKPTYFNGVLKRKYIVDTENQEIARNLIELKENSRKKANNPGEW